MKRSGTTWMYNVVRVAMNHRGLDYTISGSMAEAKKHKGRMLLKSHWWRQDVQRLATLVFTSDRDVEDVYRSLRRLWDRAPTGREMAKIVEHSRRWQRVSDYHMPYRLLLEDPRKACARIIDTLGYGVDPDAVFAEVSAIEPPEEGQDPVTLYFANHRA